MGYRFKCSLFADCILQSRDTATIFGKVLVGSKRLENLGLAEGEVDFFIIFGVCDNKVFNLIAPEQGITFLALCLVPNLQ